MLEGVRADHDVVVEWEGGKRFRGGIPGGPSIVVDGSREGGPGPVDGLLISLASCAAIDVVEILEKRRTPAGSLVIRLEFSRAPSAPRRLTEVRAFFTVATASERLHVERAVGLTFEKYCSVASSLAPDIALSWSVEILPAVADEAPG